MTTGSLRPQLSSVSTVLTDITGRVSALADTATESQRDDVAVALYEIERSLQTASRRLEQLVSDLTRSAR